MQEGYMSAGAPIYLEFLKCSKKNSLSKNEVGTQLEVTIITEPETHGGANDMVSQAVSLRPMVWQSLLFPAGPLLQTSTCL